MVDVNKCPYIYMKNDMFDYIVSKHNVFLVREKLRKLEV